MKKVIVLISIVVGSFLAGSVQADSRHFGYSYQADSVLEKGAWEFEQWLTYRTGKDGGNFYRFDIKEEVETGLTDRLTTALYLKFTDKKIDGVPGEADDESFEFDGIASEWKYMILSPNINPLGLLVYLEPSYSGKELELEAKVVLQHNFGDDWVWVLNGTLEPEWEFESAGTAKELKVEFTTGLAYKIGSNWSLGLEGRSHSVYFDFNDHISTAFFAGPAIHYEKGKGWGTLTFLPQIVSDTGSRDFIEHEAVEVRLVAGVLF